MDSGAGARHTVSVARPGAARGELSEALNAAYGAGLMSQHTLAHRLDLLLSSRLIDPVALVGDLSRRMMRPDRLARLRRWLADALGELPRRREVDAEPPMLLALDWSGGQGELLVGRHPSCDVVLSSPAVSRCHARLVFRDGGWVVQDLNSTNGTDVNGVRVGRCRLEPGDRLVLGGRALHVD